MQRFLIAFMGVMVGAAAGVLVTLCVKGKAGRFAIAEDAVILEVRPPLRGDLASTGLDDVWERQINTHMQLIREGVGGALSDVDVIHHTAWYTGFSDTDSRFDALKEALHVENVPGTCLITVSVETDSAADSRTIANALANAYFKGLQREHDRREALEAEELYAIAASLRRDEEVLGWEVSGTDESSEVERARVELASIRSHRVEVERELDGLRRRSDESTRQPIVVLRVPIRTDEE